MDLSGLLLSCSMVVDAFFIVLFYGFVPSFMGLCDFGRVFYGLRRLFYRG